MTAPALETLRATLDAAGPEAAADALITSLRAKQAFDPLFDALLIKSRLDLGLPVARPTSFDDVPADKHAAFEEAYVAAAREVGGLHLASGNLPRAWAYFRTLREPGPVAAALDALDPSTLDYDRTNEILEVALHEGANRVAGLRLLLATHGTCNTVTMTDQVLPSMTPDERRQAAAMLVRDVYGTLVSNLWRELKEKLPGTQLPPTVRLLIANRDWLFADGNYHVDVSHLHSTVRFARALTPADPELPLAIELAEYGSKLASQFRYPADPPFDDFYPAHLAYFRAVAGSGEMQDEGLHYFRHRAITADEDRDKKINAYVLIDLLLRTERLGEAAEVASAILPDLEEPGGLSFTALCVKANRLDLLRTAAERAEDPVRFTAALIEEKRRSATVSDERN